VTPRLPEPGRVLVLSRTLELCPDPVRLYAAACDRGRRSDTLLLESADHSQAGGERSLLCTRAALRLSGSGRSVCAEALSPNGSSLLPTLAERLAAACGEAVAIETSIDRLVAQVAPPRGGSERERLCAPSPLDLVRAAVLGLEVVAGDPAMPPLVAGTLAYDLLAAYETLPKAASDPTAWPDFELLLAEELVLLQHTTGRTTVLRYVLGGRHAQTAYHDAVAGLTARVELCTLVARAGDASPPPDDGEPRILGEPTVDVDDADFAALVIRLKQYIVRGDVFQIVPSRAFSLPCPDPLAAYARLRALNPSPYMFFVHGRAGVLFGASPESALTVRGEPRRVTINPIAGTRPRGRRPDGGIDADLDGRIEAELRLDGKEVAEHMMLVDLARNDVARVSEPGSRAVERLLDVVRYSHVMHLVSLVTGRLRADLDALHAYVATMNMGTLVGAPKLEAATILRRVEPARRGPYGGAVGYLTARGELDTCIVIRSAVVRDGVAQVRAGCGVVYDSHPEAEALETRRKADAVLVALRQAATARAHGA